MDLTVGTKVIAGTAGATAAGGLAVSLYGIIRSDIARAMGGTCLTLTALTAVALVLIRRWITDTRDERRALAGAQRAAQSEQARYFASQAALEVEQGRLSRDMAAERRAITARMKAEREALAAEFEERRASLIAETMEATVLMIRDGKLAPAQPTQSKVIQLRQRQPQEHPARERSREHGVVGP